MYRLPTPDGVFFFYESVPSKVQTNIRRMLCSSRVWSKVGDIYIAASPGGDVLITPPRSNPEVKLMSPSSDSGVRPISMPPGSVEGKERWEGGNVRNLHPTH